MEKGRGGARNTITGKEVTKRVVTWFCFSLIVLDKDDDDGGRATNERA